jgi:flagellar basal body rod protein FlgC
MDAISIAHSGLQASFARFNASAAAIARAQPSGMANRTGSQAGQTGQAAAPAVHTVHGEGRQGWRLLPDEYRGQFDAVSLVETESGRILDEQIKMLTSKQHVLANLSVARTARELDRVTLQLWA